MSDEKNNIHVTSINQQGGITAYQVNLQPGDRVLRENICKELDSTLRPQQFSSIRITAVMGDQEAFRYASQTMNYLISKGHEVSGVNQAVYSRPVQGQKIHPVKEDGVLDIVIGGR